MVLIKEILEKFKVKDTRITKEVLNISIDNTQLKDWKKEDYEGEKIIISGDYEEPMIKPPHNKVQLRLLIDPLEEWNHVVITKSIPNNFVSGRIYNNEGMRHTIT